MQSARPTVKARKAPGADAADPDLDGLLERFLAWGNAPTVQGYIDLFAPGGTVFEPGMSAPLSGPGITTMITEVLQLLPDFRFAAVRTARNETTLFVEAYTTATLDTNPIEWTAIYCMDATGDRVARGRRYWDRAVIARALGEDTAPEAPHPSAGPTVVAPCGFATAPTGEWFREWTGTVSPTGTPRDFGMVERYAEGELRYFYNSLLLRAEPTQLMEQHPAGLGNR